MNPETMTLVGWSVAALLAGGTGALGFLVKNAFNGTTDAVKELGAKLDVMAVKMATGDGDRRVLEARLHAAEQRLDRMERELAELSEGVAR